MSKCFYTAKVLLLGLVTAQVIATIQVHLSNAELYHTLVSIRNAGYLIIPNQRVMQGLLEFSPAFYGGLFFTLSAGAGLSLHACCGLDLGSSFFSQENSSITVPDSLDRINCRNESKRLLPHSNFLFSFHTHYCLCSRFKMDAGPVRKKGLVKQNSSHYSDHSAGIFVDISNGQRPVFEHKRQLASFQ